MVHEQSLRTLPINLLKISFDRVKLPTLDFKLWLVSGIILHSYFEKEMRTPFVIMKRSAMSEHQRMQILSNELIRLISNVQMSIVDEEMPQIIEHFTTQLKTSGYDRRLAKDIISCGVVGYRRKVMRRDREGRGFYRHARSTLRQRNKKKLLEKTTWYREKRKRAEGEEDQEDEMQLPARKKRVGERKKDQKDAGRSVEVKAVMFVPFTAGSKLAKDLRDA